MNAVRISALLSVLLVTGCSRSAIQQPAVVTTPSAQATSSASLPAVASQPATSEAVPATPGIDACALLTSEEIKAVQGEAVKETKLSGQTGGGLSTSLCFFTLPTSGNSISLVVVQKGAGADAKDPEEFWREKFHDDERDHKDRDRARDFDKDRERDRDHEKGEADGEEEEGAPPRKVTGVGQEAYWVGSRVGGALYVLKGNAYLRISVGGPSDQVDQISKAKTLAREALARL